MNAGQPSRSSFGAAKRNTLRELSEAIGEEQGENQSCGKEMCALGELIQEGDGVRGQKAVYLLTR